MTGTFSELFDDALATAAWTQIWQVTIVVLLVALMVRLTCRHLAHTLSLLLLVLVAVFVPGAALTFSEDNKPDEPQPIRLQLDADGKVLVLGRKVAGDQLKPILKQLLKLVRDGDTKPAVSIQADEETKHENLVKLIDLCRELGVTTFSLSVVRSPQSQDKTDPTAKKSPGTPRDPKSTDADAQAQQSSREFIGHTSKANAVAWSSDGKLIASGGSDDTVRLWNAATGKQLASLKCDGRQVWSVAISPDNQLVVAGCDNGSVRIWNVQSHERVASIKASEHEVWSVTFSPDSRHVASGTKDGKVQVWDAATGKEKFSASNSSQVSGIRFTQDGSMLATSSVTQPVKLWDAESGELIRTFDKAPTFQQWVAVSPNGELIATASWDGSSLLWDAKTGKLLRTFAAPPVARNHIDRLRSLESFVRRSADAHLNYVTFSPDGKLLASAGADGVIRLWDVEQGTSWGILKAHTAAAMSLAFSPDGKHLASAGEDRRVRVWSLPKKPVPQSKVGSNIEAGLQNWQFGLVPLNRAIPSRGRTVTPHWPSTNGVVQTESSTGERWTLETVAPRGRIVAINWSPDGDRVAFVDCGSVRIYEVPDMRLVRILTDHTVRDWGQPLAWSPDGETLATGGYDGTVRYWDENGVPGPVMQAHKSPVAAVRWSPSGDRVASVGYHGGIRTWNVDGSANATVAESTHWLSSVAWSPDGTKLIVGELNRAASIWRATGGRLATFTFGAPVQSVAWNPEGDIVALAGSKNDIEIWSVGGKKLHTLEGHERVVASIAWNANGNQLASGAWDSTVRLWSRGGDVDAVLKGHADAVISVAWSADGKWLASGDSNDSTLRLWSSEGKAGPVLHGHSAYPTEMKWSPDGSRIAVGGRGSDTKGRVGTWTAEGIQSSPMKAHEAGAICGIAWSPDSARLATAGGDPAFNIWTADGTLASRLFGYKRWLTDIDWSHDGKRIGTSGSDGSVRLWLAEEEPRDKGVTGHFAEEPIDVEWNPRSGLIASAAKPGDIELCKPDGNRVGTTLAKMKYDGELNGVSWNRDGSQLVALGSNGIQFFKPDGSPGPVAEGPSVNATSPHWNSAGQLLVADRNSSNLVQLWSADGKGRNLVRGWGFGFHSPHWNGAGTQFVTGGSDKAVYIFAPDGTLQSVMSGHHDTVSHTAWNPSSDLVVSAATDNTIRCWNASAGKPAWTAVCLRDHQTVTFNANGQLISGDANVAETELVFVHTTAAGTSLSRPSEARTILR